ncbi:MAG: hypothetical protein ACI9DJ_001084 [Algoriphagus sp.]|jgi:hypothetical protein
MKDDFIKFFSEMRKADEKEELPSFEAMMPKPKVTSINYDLQSGITASVLLACSYF